ncbi:MAG: dTMP kinase [Candidatus Thermoplasmatota archaeon]|nr:dTMP kinase [Candidatus Thermoplasmatota archaeon]
MASFIVIEGIDGCGKGTQARLLYEHLKELGKDVVLTAEPTKGPLGKLIREHLQDPFLDDGALALLFAADRIEHLDKVVRPALEAGKIVISDRYVYSSIAYQGQRVDLDWVSEINKYSDRPTIAILLDITVQLAQRRMKERGDEMEYFEVDNDLQEGVRKAFIELSRGRHLPDSLKTKWFVVDASERKVEIADKIRDAVESVL